MPARNHREDLRKRLASKDYAALYLETAFRESSQDQDWGAFGTALRNVIEAQDIDVAALARNSGVSRQHVYLLFRKSANPTLNTLVPVLGELKLSLSILPQCEERKKSSAA